MQITLFLPRLAALCGLGCLMAGAIAPANAQTPANTQTTAPANIAGWWMDPAGDAAVMIAACGQQLCGHVEWLRTPRDADGKPKTDIHNNNAALRTRLVCGLPMLGGFSPDGQGAWQGGWIYDPKKGATYKATMRVAADGTLHMHGYIGVPLFGRTEIMTRPAQPLQECTPD